MLYSTKKISVLLIDEDNRGAQLCSRGLHKANDEHSICFLLVEFSHVIACVVGLRVNWSDNRLFQLDAVLI